MQKLKRLFLFLGLLLCMHWTYAQTPVTGKVTDQNGAPVAGATVTIKNTNQSTVTDEGGNFTINAPEGAVLVISFVGYQSVERPAGANMTISLAQGGGDLGEVVVVGYGTRLRREVTTAIAKVSGREFQNLPISTFESALQGRTAGVFINQGSGKLGQGMSLRVRGVSSISANQQPFIVIDGVPVVSQSLGSATEPDNPLATLNPDDIESIEVLKDAASAAIYGARASNGVLLITTKSGRAGKTRVSAGYFTGWSEPTRKREFLNAAQYRELFGEAVKNSTYNLNHPTPNSDAFFENADEAFEFLTGYTDWADNPNVDQNWADEAFQNGGISQYSVSVNGGDARTKFFLSGSYNKQEGIILNNALDRLNGRFNIDHALNQRFRVGANISLARSLNERVSADNEFSNPMQLNALPPIQPKFDPATGQLNRNTIYYNNLIDQVANINDARTFRTISSIFAEARLAPTLVFRTQAGLDYNNLLEETFWGRQTLDGAPTGQAYGNQVSASVLTSTNTLNFATSIGERHDVDAVAGFEYQRGQFNGVSATGRGLPSDRFKRLGNAAISLGTGSPEPEGYVFQSFFLRGNYKFSNKFLLGATARLDGSSRFRGDRYGLFPSVSGGYIISEEPFLANSALSFLKLRGSYGSTGNAEIGNFSALNLYTSTAYADLAGIIAAQIGPDEGLTWERTDQLNIGLDFGLFRNRITGEIDFFTKNTKDLLLNVPLSLVSGFTSITKNIGSMQNKGWELVLNAQILPGAFKWNTSFNISTYRNKVTSLVVPVPPGARTLGRLAVGQPFGQFFGLKYAGVDPNNGDALYALENGGTTNDPTDAPDMIIGNPHPDFYGGLNNRFSYMGFDLDVQCQFVSGNDVYNMAGFFQSVNGDFYDNQTVDQMNYWRKPGDVTNIPQPRLIDANGTEKSSRWVEDGSYFRVKSVNFGYNLPRNILNRFKMENMRVYVAASNLFTFTDYTGYDPEVNATYIGGLNLGHDFYTPPQIKTISVGINIGF
ncbi:MAG TPA: TonB-dependent receptor [Chitinophagaceae bacterium]|jgi:TonB-linked SusC/RagA family outer membrane protein|nr:TonB-dependent receptor [Chitinophagaceae bacterium]